MNSKPKPKITGHMASVQVIPDTMNTETTGANMNMRPSTVVFQPLGILLNNRFNIGRDNIELMIVCKQEPRKGGFLWSRRIFRNRMVVRKTLF